MKTASPNSRVRTTTIIALALVMVLATACGTTSAHAAAATAGAAPPSETIVLTDRSVDMKGSIGMSMIKKLQAKFFAFDNESSDPIWLRINSGGGSVEAGLILIDTFQALKSPVYCLVESKAYSMAAITLVFCDRKYALPHATIMMHEASYGTVGDDPSNRSRLDFLTRYLDKLHHQIAERLSMPHDKYRAKIRDAWWLLAPEAHAVGIVDKVVKSIEYKQVIKEKREDKTTVTVSEITPVIPDDVAVERIPKRR